MSDDESSGDEQPSEAELALKKRREATRQASSGLDDDARELLETNRQDRERMEEEIRELRKRNEKRKKEREEEEKRLAAERAAEEERRKAVDEAKRKQKEEEELRKKKERDSKKAEVDKMQNVGKPNFVISKRTGSSGDEEAAEAQGPKKSREQLENEKRAILKQRTVELNVTGLDQSGLSEKCKELHKLLYRLESEKYDLEKRFKIQQVEMQELAERARQANRVGREGVKRVVLAEGESDPVQERYAGTPAKIEMFSKYERQKDKRTYPERKTVYTGPQYILPPEKIKPTKIVKWGEQGLPVYEDIPGAEGGEGGEGHEH
jgi:hypothetical protein